MPCAFLQTEVLLGEKVLVHKKDGSLLPVPITGLDIQHEDGLLAPFTMEGTRGFTGVGDFAFRGPA